MSVYFLNGSYLDDKQSWNAYFNVYICTRILLWMFWIIYEIFHCNKWKKKWNNVNIFRAYSYPQSVKIRPVLNEMFSGKYQILTSIFRIKWPSLLEMTFFFTRVLCPCENVFQYVSKVNDVLVNVLNDL